MKVKFFWVGILVWYKIIYFFDFRRTDDPHFGLFQVNPEKKEWNLNSLLENEKNNAKFCTNYFMPGNNCCQIILCQARIVLRETRIEYVQLILEKNITLNQRILCERERSASNAIKVHFVENTFICREK